ncbi:hypothetical protein GJAV_G00028250 [Gymnothorax javanicus]|nr:hypothetical protein GJAV_G00028250 [Gymnothorax javanicus]
MSVTSPTCDVLLQLVAQPHKLIHCGDTSSKLAEIPIGKRKVSDRLRVALSPLAHTVRKLFFIIFRQEGRQKGSLEVIPCVNSCTGYLPPVTSSAVEDRPKRSKDVIITQRLNG